MNAAVVFESERRLVRLKALRDDMDREIANLERDIEFRRSVMPPVLLAKAMPTTSEKVMRQWLIANGHNIDPHRGGRLTSEQRRAYAAAMDGAA